MRTALHRDTTRRDSHVVARVSRACARARRAAGQGMRHPLDWRCQAVQFDNESAYRQENRMKRFPMSIVVLAAALGLSGTAQAQTSGTLKKIQDSGSITIGHR